MIDLDKLRQVAEKAQPHPIYLQERLRSSASNDFLNIFAPALVLELLQKIEECEKCLKAKSGWEYRFLKSGEQELTEKLAAAKEALEFCADGICSRYSASTMHCALEQNQQKAREALAQIKGEK